MEYLNILRNMKILRVLAVYFIGERSVNRGSTHIVPADEITYLENYKTLILHYADLCVSNGIQYISVSNEIGVIGYTSHNHKSAWQDIITSLKNKGLTVFVCISNGGGEVQNNCFLDLVDIIGINVYPAICISGSESISLSNKFYQMGWYNDYQRAYNTIQNIIYLKETYSKTIWATECGCCNSLEALIQPGIDIMTTPSQDAQNIYYEIMLSILFNLNNIESIFIWTLSGFTFVNKSAENTVKSYFGGV